MLNELQHQTNETDTKNILLNEHDLRDFSKDIIIKAPEVIEAAALMEVRTKLIDLEYDQPKLDEAVVHDRARQLELEAVRLAAIRAVDIEKEGTAFFKIHDVKDKENTRREYETYRTGRFRSIRSSVQHSYKTGLYTDVFEETEAIAETIEQKIAGETGQQLAEQLRALVIKRVADKQLDAIVDPSQGRITTEMAHTDIQWGMEASVDEFIKTILTKGRRDTARAAGKLVTRYNEEAQIQEEKVFKAKSEKAFQMYDDAPPSLENTDTAFLSKRVLGANENSALREAASPFAEYVAKHLQSTEGLLKKNENYTGIQILGTDGLERGNYVDDQGNANIGDVLGIGMGTIRENIRSAFFLVHFEAERKTDEFAKAFQAKLTKELGPEDTFEKKANMQMLQLMGRMAFNFNEATANDLATVELPNKPKTRDEARPSTDEVKPITFEEVIRATCLLIGKETALQVDPNFDLDTRSPLNSLPSEHPQAHEFSEALEQLSNTFLNARKGKIPWDAETKNLLSYACINTISKLRECDEAGIVMFPRLISGTQEYAENVLGDPQPKGTRERNAEKKAKQDEAKRRSKTK